MASFEYDLVVVGSGIAGLSSAYRLKDDFRVLVLDQGPLGGGTSSRASGVITPAVDYADMPAWADHAHEFFREFDGRGLFHFDSRPHIKPVRPTGHEHARERARRDGVSLLEPAEAAARFPDVLVDPEQYTGVLVYRNTGMIEVETLLSTLIAELKRSGVQCWPDTRVKGIRTEDGSVQGVITEHGEISVPRVVCAAGSATADLLNGVLEVPLRPFTWNVALLRPSRPPGDEFPMGGDNVLGVYWRPTPEGYLLVGAEDEPEDSGGEPAISESFRRLVRDSLPDLLVPAIDARPVRWEHCRTADSTTPDTRPIVDAPVEGPRGLVLAAGFHGAGVMAAGSIGTAVRSLLIDEPAPFPLEPFRLSRFSDRSVDFPFQSVFDRTL